MVAESLVVNKSFPWSNSAYGRRLVSERLWVRIPIPNTKHILICLIIPIIKEKEAGDGPFLFKKYLSCNYPYLLAYDLGYFLVVFWSSLSLSFELLVDSISLLLVLVATNYLDAWNRTQDKRLWSGHLAIRPFHYSWYFIEKWPNPGLFLILFSSFQNSLQ